MTIYEKIKRGIPLDDVLVIDAHAHSGLKAGFREEYASDKFMIEEMDNLGINIACISHLGAISADQAYGNDRVIESTKNFPGRFLGYCTINPHYPELIRPELERCFKFEGIIGIKLHPWSHDRTMDYKNYVPVYEFAAEKKCVVLVHIYSWEEVCNIGRFAGEYPEAIFIMAHTGGEWVHMERAVDVVNRYDNMYTDLAVSRSWEGGVEWLVSQIGSKKLLFGTDMNAMDARACLARVGMAEISEEEKKDVLGLNMKKILKL